MGFMWLRADVAPHRTSQGDPESSSTAFRLVNAVFQLASDTAFASSEGRLRSVIVSSVDPSRSESAQVTSW